MPAAQPEPSLWSAIDANVGYPAIIVGGVDLCERANGVRWSLGRSSMLDGPEPDTASFDLVDAYETAIGTPVAIAAPPAGDLWHGYVDTIAQTTTPDGTTTSVGCVGSWSKLLSTELSSPTAFAAGTLVDRLLRLAALAGVTPPGIHMAPSVGVLPQLAAVAAFTGDLAGHVDAVEKASNAIVAVLPDGSWSILARDAYPPSSSPPLVELIDESCPSELEVAVTTADHVRNSFTIAGALTERPLSIAQYGRRTYDVPAGIAAEPPPYSVGFFDAVASPARYATAHIPIDTRLAAVVPIAPFDYVRTPDDVVYQTLGVDWEAAPDTWRATLALDRTQSSIANTPDPVPPEPPTTATRTDVFACNADAYGVLTGGGVHSGNGASVDLLVGLLADGQLARGFVKFGISWAGKVVRVTKATLRLRVGEESCMSYGSSPTVKVYRVSAAWSEGTYGTRCAFSSSNALTYPGPAVTSSGAVTKDCARSESAIVDVVVTAIVQAWAGGSPNYGFALRGASESSSADRCVFWSRSASSGVRPTLTVTYEYEV
jgi:hypothetical protein